MAAFIRRARTHLLFVTLLIFSLPVQAADRFWLNTAPNDPNFNDTINWTGGVVPTNVDTAIFNGNNSDVWFQTNVVNSRAIIRNTETTFDLNGNTYQLTLNAFPESALTVGQLAGDVGVLNITDGTLSTNVYTSIGIDATSQGTINVGAGATLNTSAIVGLNGEGILNVTDGGTMASSLSAGQNLWLGYYDSGIGRVTVDGGTSSVTALGTNYFGNGTNSTGNLTVSDGGSMQGGITYLGYNTGSNSTVNIGTDTSGSGSWTTSTAYYGSATDSVAIVNIGADGGAGAAVQHGSTYLGYGNNSSATVDIRGGSQVQAGVYYMAYNANSSTDVDLTGSSLTATDLRVGYQGDATFDVYGGSQVTSTSVGFIGNGAGSTSSRMTVDASTWTNNGILYVGNAGNGTLNINNGSTVTNTEAHVGRVTGAVGAVNVTDSTWTSTGHAYFGGVSSAATSNYAGQATLNADNATISTGWGYLGWSIGSTGNATLDNGSTWTNTGMYVGYYGQGSLLVDNGSSVNSTTSDILIGYSTGAPSSTVTVRGGSSSITGAGAMRIYDGTLNIEQGASVDTGTYGYLYYNATANYASAANVTGGSTWDITQYLIDNGTLTIDGGSTVTVGQYVNLSNSPSVLNVSDSQLDIGTYFTNYGSVDVAGATAEINITDHFYQYGDMNVTGGAKVNVGDFFYVTTGDNTTISGAGSSVVAASRFLDQHHIAGSFEILDGGSLRVGVGSILNNSTMNVAGNGASFTSDSEMYVGGHETGDSSGTDTLNLELGGTATATTTLKIWPGGVVNLNGGTLNLETLDLAGGVLNHNAGLLNFTQDLIIGSAGPYPSYTLNSQQSLGVEGTATLHATGALTLDGGTFTAGNFIRTGAFTFNTGTFNLTNQDVTIGAGGLFGDNVQATSGQTYNVSQVTTVADDGVLALNGGRYSAGTGVNDGEIVLASSSSRLGGAWTNNKLLHGDGRVDAVVTNAAGADIRAGSGEILRFTAAGNTNAGRIEAINGEVAFDENLVNQASTGNIVGRDAILRFDGGLENRGSVGLTFGLSDVFGDIDNTATGLVVVSGGGSATFYDDYSNDGETRVSAGSSAVFFGGVTGSNGVTGTGTVYFEGDISLGNSPGLIDFEGSTVFGNAATLIMELAGLDRGTEYDAFDVGGFTELGGALDIDLLSGFTPTAGDYFDLIVAASITGSFGNLLLPGLSGNLYWDLQVLDGTSADTLRLAVQAVPVPAAAWLFGSALLLLGWARKRA